MKHLLENRTEAGQLLALRLTEYTNDRETWVLALPRGGVPVAFEIARKLNLPLDLCLVRKLGVPRQKELAMGAIAKGVSSAGDRGIIRVMNDRIVRDLQLSEETIEQVAREEEQELTRRDRLYRGERPFPDMRGKTIILVDDGIATGATLKAAILTLKPQNPRSIVVAVPVAHPDICHQLEEWIDRVVCLIQPEFLQSISLWYRDFPQTSDREVRDLLAEASLQLTGTSTNPLS